MERPRPDHPRRAPAQTRGARGAAPCRLRREFGYRWPVLEPGPSRVLLRLRPPPAMVPNPAVAPSPAPGTARGIPPGAAHRPIQPGSSCGVCAPRPPFPQGARKIVFVVASLEAKNRCPLFCAMLYVAAMPQEPPFRLPPEWHPQDWLWIGFPHDAEEWPGFLAEAQEQIADFASAVAETGQEVRLLVGDDANEARARQMVSSRVRLEQRTYGDIWLRDTGPLVVCDPGGNRIARRFGFNGWGGKYPM